MRFDLIGIAGLDDAIKLSKESVVHIEHKRVGESFKQTFSEVIDQVLFFTSVL